MTDDIQVFMPTSLAPWHPSIAITEEAINSLRALLGNGLVVNIYCDGLPGWATSQDRIRYGEYIHKLSDLQGTNIIEISNWMGLSGLVRQFISDIHKPLVFNMQHDWIFIRPERVDAAKLVAAMLTSPELQVVRFHKRPLPQAKKYVDRTYYEEDIEKYGVPLIRTDGWGDSPHMARAEHYRNRVLEHLDTKIGKDGRFGLEGPLASAYRRDVRQLGFDRAQKEWGVFIYGKFGDVGYIDHLGGAAKAWRKQRKLGTSRPETWWRRHLFGRENKR
jgi:hypothetical protein